MPRSATLNGNQTIDTPKQNVHEDQNPTGKSKRGSPLMHSLTPEMITDPYPLDFVDGMDSQEFALEKCQRLIVTPLGFQSQKDWLDFAKQVWVWMEAAPTREKQATVDDLMGKIKSDTELLALFKKRLESLT